MLCEVSNCAAGSTTTATQDCITLCVVVVSSIDRSNNFINICTFFLFVRDCHHENPRRNCVMRFINKSFKYTHVALLILPLVFHYFYADNG